MNKIKLLAILLGFVISSCEEAKEHPVPDVSVSVGIRSSELGGGDSQRRHGGYAGVIVYCLSPGTYYAYDACCPYEHNRNAIIEPDGSIGICNKCGSTFVLIDGGFPTDGPAKTPLKQYSVYESYGYVRVHN